MYLYLFYSVVNIRCHIVDVDVITFSKRCAATANISPLLYTYMYMYIPYGNVTFIHTIRVGTWGARALQYFRRGGAWPTNYYPATYSSQTFNPVDSTSYWSLDSKSYWSLDKLIRFGPPNILSSYSTVHLMSSQCIVSDIQLLICFQCLVQPQERCQHTNKLQN